MKNLFYDFFDFFATLDESWFMLSSFAFILFFGIINLLVTAFKRVYTFSQKSWFLFLALAITALDGFYCSLSGSHYYLVSAFLGLTLFAFAVPFRRKPKRAATKKERLIPIELVKEAEQKLREESMQSTQRPFREESMQGQFREPDSPKISVPPDKPTMRPDFSHVRNVIERLSYFPLSAPDRRQINELEALLVSAERDGDGSAKDKLNEKLSSLLKIMAKYGA